MKNLRNRSFLTLLDFSRQEVEFLLTLSEDLKRAKYIGTEKPMLKIKISRFFEKIPLEHVAHSKLPHMIKVHTSLILDLQVLKWVKRNC